MDFPALVLAVLAIAAAAAMLGGSTGRHAPVAIAASAAVLLLHGVLYFDYTADDAYISFRYARSLSEGAGLVWNPGEYVEGYTNFLWVMVLAGVHRLTGDIDAPARWLGLVAGVVAAGGAYALTRQILGHSSFAGLAGLAAALLLASSGPFALWTASGMENGLFAALIVGAVLLHIREYARPRYPLSGALWALAAMTRPDGALLFTVSAVFKAGEAWLRFAAVRPYWRRMLALWSEAGWLLFWLAGFLVIYVPYFAWRITTYGRFFPNTYYAKVGGGVEQFDRGLVYLTTYAQQYAAWLIVLLPLALALTTVRRHPALYVMALLATWTAYVVYVGGDSLVRFRFFASISPLFYAAVAAGGTALLTSLRFERAPRRTAVAGGVALAGAALLAFTLWPSTDTGFQAEREATRERVEIGRWLRENVPPDTLIAVIAAGAVPYESGLLAVDMLGITDEHIAHRDVALGGAAAGHEKFHSEYVLDRAPDIILLLGGTAPRPWTRVDYERLDGTLIPATADMARNERLWREYEARSVEIREGEWLNLLVREGASEVRERTQSAEEAGR